ncbi:hypothetical protein P0O15_02790 [Methanotrichaceae archaeon Mx]|uniref:Uncharacterized protein n=1 Tax=Candidatus Methanocrinis natronophilus TaxID=3033396 RepID=A0ABT5X5Y9_9EURY|nr:hypothetical protein [Candidatus Methanocrinis natronophilus]
MITRTRKGGSPVDGWAGGGGVAKVVHLSTFQRSGQRSLSLYFLNINFLRHFPGRYQPDLRNPSAARLVCSRKTSTTRGFSPIPRRFKSTS